MERRKIPLNKYARTTLLVYKQVDRLFLLLAARKYSCHVSLAHMDGVWTSHKDGNMHKTDIMIAQTTDGFCENKISSEVFQHFRFHIGAPGPIDTSVEFVNACFPPPPPPCNPTVRGGAVISMLSHHTGSV